MLDRVGALLPHDISRIWGGTFHSVANRLLRRHANKLGFSSHFTILDRDDAADLAVAALKATGLDPKDKTLPKGAVLLDVFGFAANTEKSIAAVVDSHYPYFNPIVSQLESIQRVFAERKRADNVMDYDDLLVYALKLLRDDEELRRFYQEQFQHVLVDEYQDTNKIQSDFIDTLAAFHHQVMAVGDDAQSIYSWRGANFENVLTFPQRFPGAREVRIETNYPQHAGNPHPCQSRHRREHAAVPEEFALGPAGGKTSQAGAGLPAGREHAGRVHLPAHRRADRGGHRGGRNRGALPRSFSFHGAADGDDPPPDSVRAAERAALLRAGAHQGRGLVPQVRAQPEGRAGVQAHRRPAAGRGPAHRGQALGKTGQGRRLCLARAAREGRRNVEAVGGHARADCRARPAKPRLGADPDRDRPQCTRIT